MDEASKFALTIPQFQGSSELCLPLDKTKEGEKRLIEAKTVNPLTYTELEYCFNEGYRELRRHLATIGFQLTEADKALETAKSNFLIDEYHEKIKDLPKSMDSADLRKAHLMRCAPYTEAMDRVNMLKAMEALLDGKIKTFEKTCAYMKKQIDLLLRSGQTSPGLYKR